MATTEIEKTPTADTSVNKPESGTYGEAADLAALKAQLPPMNTEGFGPATGGPAPMPEPSMAPPELPGGRPANLPPGVPSVILGDVAPGAFESMAPTPQPTVTPEQVRLALLEQLAVSPDVTEETRQWAQLVLDMLTGA